MVYPLESIARGEKFVAAKAPEGIHSLAQLYSFTSDLAIILDSMRYGISDGISSGKIMRYPHEISSQVNCAEAAILSYNIFRAANLSPQLIRMDETDNTGSAHMAVVVEFEQEQYIYNPLAGINLGKIVSLNAPITYNPIEKLVVYLRKVDENGNDVDDTPPSSVHVLNHESTLICSQVEVISEDTLCDQIEYYRTPEGFFHYIQNGQLVHRYTLDDKHYRATIDTYLRVEPETDELVICSRYQDAFLYHYWDELYMAINEDGSITEGRRKLTLTEGARFTQKTDEVYSREQKVAIHFEDGTPILTPRGKWKGSEVAQGDVHELLPDNYRKLRAHMIFECIRKKEKTRFFMPNMDGREKRAPRVMKKYSDYAHLVARINPRVAMHTLDYMIFAQEYLDMRDRYFKGYQALYDGDFEAVAVRDFETIEDFDSEVKLESIDTGTDVRKIKRDQLIRIFQAIYSGKENYESYHLEKRLKKKRAQEKRKKSRESGAWKEYSQLLRPFFELPPDLLRSPPPMQHALRRYVHTMHDFWDGLHHGMMHSREIRDFMKLAQRNLRLLAEK